MAFTMIFNHNYQHTLARAFLCYISINMRNFTATCCGFNYSLKIINNKFALPLIDDKTSLEAWVSFNISSTENEQHIWMQLFDWHNKDYSMYFSSLLLISIDWFYSCFSTLVKLIRCQLQTAQHKVTLQYLLFSTNTLENNHSTFMSSSLHNTLSTLLPARDTKC